MIDVLCRIICAAGRIESVQTVGNAQNCEERNEGHLADSTRESALIIKSWGKLSQSIQSIAQFYAGPNAYLCLFMCLVAEMSLVYLTETQFY